MAAKNSSFKTADIDEKSIRREKPEELVMALAEAKADAIISKLKITSHVEDDAYSTLLITADTVYYSGGHVTVVGSVLVTNLVTGTRKGEWDRAEVLFPICILRER
ncbi:hypothetical protein C3L33_01115, partial [Rhododendron williamsianum]